MNSQNRREMESEEGAIPNAPDLKNLRRFVVGSLVLAGVGIILIALLTGNENARAVIAAGFLAIAAYAVGIFVEDFFDALDAWKEDLG